MLAAAPRHRRDEYQGLENCTVGGNRKDDRHVQRAYCALRNAEPEKRGAGHAFSSFLTLLDSHQQIRQ